MEEIFYKVSGDSLIPHTTRDLEKHRKYKDGQTIRTNTSGIKKDRAYSQLCLWKRCAEIVAENTEDPNWNTPLKVETIVKIRTGFIEDKMVADVPCSMCGHNTQKVQFITKSLEYATCDHKDATKVISDGLEIMADKIGVTVEELIGNADV